MTNPIVIAFVVAGAVILALIIAYLKERQELAVCREALGLWVRNYNEAVIAGARR